MSRAMMNAISVGVAVGAVMFLAGGIAGGAGMVRSEELRQRDLGQGTLA